MSFHPMYKLTFFGNYYDDAKFPPYNSLQKSLPQLFNATSSPIYLSNSVLIFSNISIQRVYAVRDQSAECGTKSWMPMIIFGNTDSRKMDSNYWNLISNATSQRKRKQSLLVKLVAHPSLRLLDVVVFPFIPLVGPE